MSLSGKWGEGAGEPQREQRGTVIVGEVQELAGHIPTVGGPLIRARIVGLQSRQNVYMPLEMATAMGLAIGTRVRLVMELVV